MDAPWLGQLMMIATGITLVVESRRPYTDADQLRHHEYYRKSRWWFWLAPLTPKAVPEGCAGVLLFVRLVGVLMIAIGGLTLLPGPRMD